MGEGATSSRTAAASPQATAGKPRAARTQQGEVPPRSHWHRHWAWPLGLAIAGLGGAAAFMLRGCWHTHMSWPVRVDDDFSYQTCTACGIKRLYDISSFRAYGPYGYDLHELIARERAARMRRLRRHEEELARRAEARARKSADTTKAESR